MTGPTSSIRRCRIRGQECCHSGKASTDRIGSEIEGLNGISGDVVAVLESINKAIQGVNEYVMSTAAAVEEQSTVISKMSSSMQRAADEARAIAAGMIVGPRG